MINNTKKEIDLKEKEDFIRKAEGKMMECKTNEEYQAAQKEISRPTLQVEGKILQSIKY